VFFTVKFSWRCHYHISIIIYLWGYRRKEIKRKSIALGRYRREEEMTVYLRDGETRKKKVRM
jgi:hypothetical protein